MKSVPSRGSVGSTPIPEATPSKPQAIHYLAAILISSPLRVVIRAIDPALPRIGTDVMTIRVVMRTIDPALPRIDTDVMTLRAVTRIIDTALPRIGIDFMTLCGHIID